MRTVLLASGLCLALAAADKPEWRGSAADQRVRIEARAYIDRNEMKAVLGQDPGENVVIVEVTLTPLGGEKLLLDRDEFLLRSDRDGQKSRPLEPSQIAGNSVMVISSRGGTQGAGMAEERRVPWGVPGVPGGSPTGGPPMGLPVPGQSPNVGSATADTSDAAASLEDRPVKANPLLDALKRKIFPDGEMEKPASGLLYFLIEGKLRAKDLEFVYRKAPPRLSMRFKDPNKK